MGSPMVFHTAPPQPASKARMICSPQLVGGAEASQKGFGESMRPANERMRMSGIGRLSDFEHGECGAFAIGHGIHYFAAAVGAVATCKVTGILCAPGGSIADDYSVLHWNLAELAPH